jgi:hypothetical protein
MKYLFFFCSLLYFCHASAFESFSGYIQAYGSKKILKTEKANLVLISDTTEVQIQINKLNNSDFISGVGNKTNNGTLSIESIDFIGLNQFLGLWMSPLGLFQVKDFSNLNIYIPQRNIPISGPKTSLNYSITPGDGNSWTMFLSDENQIYYSNLYMTDKKATIRFFNTQTGAFINEVTMSKLKQ